MATQLESARAGIITGEMKKAVEKEPISPEQLRDLIAAGLAVLPRNVNHSFADPRAIGKNLKTKVNANLGTSGECCSMVLEKEKLDAALRAGADSIMDLSTGEDLPAFRNFFLENSPVMVGAVPIYWVATEMMHKHRSLDTMGADELMRSIEQQCSEGIDYNGALRGDPGIGKKTGVIRTYNALREPGRLDSHELDAQKRHAKPAL